jgi:ribosome-associated protein
VELGREAAVTPKRRRPTRPTAGSQKRRLETKKRRGTIKGLRQAKPSFD